MGPMRGKVVKIYQPMGHWGRWDNDDTKVLLGQIPGWFPRRHNEVMDNQANTMFKCRK